MSPADDDAEAEPHGGAAPGDRVDTLGRHEVIKLGGSLLDWDRLDETLQQWLAGQTRVDWELIVGGGAQVDRLRSEQSGAGWSDEDCHWRAIDAMSNHSHALAQRLRLPLVCPHQLGAIRPFSHLSSRTEGTRSPSSRSPARGRIIDLGPLLKQLDPLPRNWEITSDSIAAWYASQTRACRLTLLKSRDARPSERGPTRIDGAGSARQEDRLVDPQFWNYLDERIELQLVNLRGFGCD